MGRPVAIEPKNKTAYSICYVFLDHVSCSWVQSLLTWSVPDSSYIEVGLFWM